ncbi:hypothetical protein ACQ4WX_51010 [Streptomyces lasalocidi]
MPAGEVLCEHVGVLASFHEVGEELIDWPEQAVDRLAVLATAQRQQHSVAGDASGRGDRLPEGHPTRAA